LMNFSHFVLPIPCQLLLALLPMLSSTDLYCAECAARQHPPEGHDLTITALFECKKPLCPFRGQKCPPARSTAEQAVNRALSDARREFHAARRGLWLLCVLHARSYKQRASDVVSQAQQPTDVNCCPPTERAWQTQLCSVASFHHNTSRETLLTGTAIC
jgi:hypothetical protein